MPTVVQAPVVTNETFISGPVIKTNFADPCFVQVEGSYYAFATNIYRDSRENQVNVQLATSSDFTHWNLTEQDALPDVGAWAEGTHIWAPDVVQLVRYPDEPYAEGGQLAREQDDGSFVMYYSARHAEVRKTQCVGVATSKTVQGPYTPRAEPLFCPLR